MKKTNDAFTMIEMVMVIVLIAILAVVAIPQSLDMGMIRLDMAAQRMRSDIRYAQSLAVSTQRWTRVAFSALSDNYTVYIDNTGAIPSGWTVAVNPLLKAPYTVQLNSGNFASVDITTVFFNASDRELVFDRWGNPYSYTGSGIPVALNNIAEVRLISGSNQKYVRVERGTGRASIQ